MSEYQYYEFQAIDRPLTVEQMVELRSISTRATSTATRFTNTYHWGEEDKPAAETGRGRLVGRQFPSPAIVRRRPQPDQ